MRMNVFPMRISLLVSLAAFFAVVADAATLENRWLKVTGGGKSAYKIYRKGYSSPFATFSGRSNSGRVEVSLPADSPFVHFTVAPDTATADRRQQAYSLPAIQLQASELGDAFSLRTMGSGGLQFVLPGRVDGSVMYMAAVKPRARCGVVTGWLTAFKANGTISSRVKEGSLFFTPSLDYGNCLVKAGSAIQPEKFVIGYFDDCRIGLESYADAVRVEHSIKLKPQIAGYCTWYAEEPYGWGGDEKSTREFAALVKNAGVF